jgi:hypothetical protein
MTDMSEWNEKMRDQYPDELPKIGDETIDHMIAYCFRKRMDSPWYQDCESALRELKEFRRAHNTGLGGEGR